MIFIVRRFYFIENRYISVMENGSLLVHQILCINQMTL